MAAVRFGHVSYGFTLENSVGVSEMSESASAPDWSVEKEYQSRIAALTPAERVARSVAMFNMTRESIGRQVIAELGEMSYERLRWEVALRLYASEPSVCEMIRERLKNVPS